MNRLTSISIRGFRRLEDVQGLELRPLNVLIGPNGVGKSTFLELLRLAARSAKQQLREAVSEAGGLYSLLTRGRAESLGLQVEWSADGPGLRYGFSLVQEGFDYSLRNESLEATGSPDAILIASDSPYVGYRSSGITARTRKRNVHETALSQIALDNPSTWEFVEGLSKLSHYSARDLDLSPRGAVRSPQPIRPTALPGHTGEDLVSCLYSMRETQPDSFEKVCDGLRAVFPSFERLDFPPVAAGTLAFTWKEREFDRPIYAHELSDGTLRFLWLATLLGSPALTPITLIDEPEVSLHPVMLSLLADLLREAAMQTQVIVATHSERLIRFLKPAEVLVLDVVDGKVAPEWADTMDLDAWLSEYTLDELWRMNRLGGNP
jgi:predicted ATPase